MRRGEQPPWIVPDGLWQRIEPLLPKYERNPRHPGRRRIPDRQVLCGILFVLHTGIQWEFLPRELESEGVRSQGSLHCGSERDPGTVEHVISSAALSTVGVSAPEWRVTVVWVDGDD